MQKLLSVAVLAAIFGLSACNKDEETNSSDLSKTEAKAELAEFNANATTELQELASSKGLEAILDLGDLADPFGGRISTDRKKIRTFFRNKGNAFRTIIDKKYDASGRTKEEAFDFEANTGVYTWNSLEEQFVRTADSDIIKIQFPTEGSSTNNAELQLLAYEEVGFYDEDAQETIYEPTVLQAALIVDGNEEASVDLAVEWDNGFPVTADFTAEVGPFTTNVNFDITASDKNTLSASLLRNQNTIFETSVTVLYSSADKTEEDLKSISGHVQLKNIKVEGSIDIEGMDATQDIDYNEFIDLTILADNKKVGVVVFIVETENGVEESVPYIEYADGTKEKLEDVLQPVIDEFESLEEDLNG